MASVDRDAQSGVFHIRFRFGGRSFKRSTKTKDEKVAWAKKARVEETIRLIEDGRLTIPPDADPGAFILSDGQLNGKSILPTKITLEGLVKLYHEHLPVGAKEMSTLEGEDIHLRHLLKFFKPSKVLATLTTADIQDYITARCSTRYRGNLVSPDTAKKEITTFGLIWNWAESQGYLAKPFSRKGLVYPKQNEKPPFMPWDEIERIIGRGGLTEKEEKKLWDCLYLTIEQISDVLEHIREFARHRFVYPMSVLVAHTGMRRSEMMRSLIDDFDFQLNKVKIREKKKSKSKAMTFRYVEMTPLLETTMQDWFANHPGGQFAICQELKTHRGKKRSNYIPLTASEARHHFGKTLEGSKWASVKGFHVFRHSFVSNAAAAGVDQRIIDEWTGHQTEEMRRRYRHLFPDQKAKAINSVFGGNGQ